MKCGEKYARELIRQRRQLKRPKGRYQKLKQQQSLQPDRSPADKEFRQWLVQLTRLWAEQEAVILTPSEVTL
jgi:hypothetical protein